MWHVVDYNNIPMDTVEKVLRSFKDDPEVWNHISAIPNYGIGWEVWTEDCEVWEKIATKLCDAGMTRIRRSVKPMAFDRRGIHATGREVLENYYGIFMWVPEYEDEDTTDFLCTDPEDDDEE